MTMAQNAQTLKCTHTHTMKIEIEECQKVDDKRQKREERGGKKEH